jgi:hypothetical protein
VISLYLIAAHYVGDFMLQTRWQAEAKLYYWRVRVRHVLAYSLPFVVLLVYMHPPLWKAVAFYVLLCGAHFGTDSRRFTSTVGDRFAWVGMSDAQHEAHYAERRLARGGTRPLPLPPNPWEALPIMIDQSLHLVQIAILGGLFLA